MRETHLELIRVTEAAAIEGAHWVGSGDKLSADKAATDAMRDRLDQVRFKAKVIIGEGKKDKSFGLFFGEMVGTAKDQKNVPCYEIAVDPIDGTRPTVEAGPEAISVLALAGEKAFFPTEAHYMNKLAWGPAVTQHGGLDIRDSIEKTIRTAAKALGKAPAKMTVCVLNRPRHEKLIASLRALSVRVKLIQDCDVSGAIATCLDQSGIDLYCGAGGAPEAVLTAAAMKCLRGGFQAQICDDKGAVSEPKVLEMEDLAKGPCIFVATGVTDGSLLNGVRFTARGPVTHSVFMRSESGTVRWLTTNHGSPDLPA